MDQTNLVYTSVVEMTKEGSTKIDPRIGVVMSYCVVLSVILEKYLNPTPGHGSDKLGYDEQRSFDDTPKIVLVCQSIAVISFGIIWYCNEF